MRWLFTANELYSTVFGCNFLSFISNNWEWDKHSTKNTPKLKKNKNEIKAKTPLKDEVSVVNGGRNRGTNVTRNRSHLLHSSCRPVSLRSLFVLSSGHVTRATCEGDAAVGLVSKPEGNSRH